MLVSVIIPVKYNFTELDNFLACMSRQSYPADLIEIIVVNHGENEIAGSLNTKFPGVRWQHEPGRSAYIARNLGVMQSHGKILAFTEVDCRPEEDWIMQGVEMLTCEGAADAFAGRIALEYSEARPSSILHWYQHCITSRQEDNIAKRQFGSAANLMVLARTFKAIGFFDGRFEIIGDRHWGESASQAGYTLDYAPNISVVRPASESFGGLVSRSRKAARESLIQDSKNRVSRSEIVWNSLRLFFPDLSVVDKVLRRGGRFPLLVLPGVLGVDWIIRMVGGVERVLLGLSDLWRDLKRIARKLMPYPAMWARLSGSQVPVSYITGRKSGLIRPESISFTTSGHMLAVCNSEGHSVSIYKSVNGPSRNAYHGGPARTISNAESLKYIHDAVLSPCGSYVVTVARDAHTLSLFDDIDHDNGRADRDALWTIQGKASGLDLPTGVAIHPSGDYIAVANRKGTGITLYRKRNGTLQFESSPVQTIAEDELYPFDLASPHGLDFSPDGNYLLVSHKRFRKWGNVGGGQSGLAIFKWRQGAGPGLDPAPTAVRTYGAAELHSVSIHPAGELVAVTDEGFGVNILRYSPETEELSPLDSFPIFRIGASIKGVGFTRDGQQLAVTCELDEVLFFDLPAE